MWTTRGLHYSILATLAQPAPSQPPDANVALPQPSNPQDIVEKTIGNLFVTNLRLRAEVDKLMAEVDKLNAENKRLHDELEGKSKK